MTKIYIVLGLLTIILVSCLSTFYFRNMTETFQTNHIQNHIIFLTKEELTEFIERDNDTYIASFSKDDLQIRNSRSVHDYKNTIQHSFCSVEQSIQDKISKCIFFNFFSLNKRWCFFSYPFNILITFFNN